MVIFEINSSNFSNHRILQKNKNALIWDQKCLLWVLLNKNIRKTLLIFEISTLEFGSLQSFVQKIKILRFRTKDANFRAGN